MPDNASRTDVEPIQFQLNNEHVRVCDLLKLTGGADSPPAPTDRSIYGMLIAERKADIFLTYCTNAVVALREVSGSRMLAPPATLAVGASYAFVVMNDANPATRRFALYILSLAGQSILARHGFTPVALP